MDSLETLTAKMARAYGDDVAQQAALLALEYQGGLTFYAAAMAKILHQSGYNDGLLSYRSRKRWHREQAIGLTPERMGSRAGSDPYDLVVARAALRAIPAWLVDQHCVAGFVCRHRCAHPMSRWFLGHLRGHPTVRCQSCLAAHARVHRRKDRYARAT